jgi:hypothetical protein
VRAPAALELEGRQQTTTHRDGGAYGTDDPREEDGLQLAEGAVSEEADEVVVGTDLSDDEEGGRRDVPLL